MVNQTLVNTVMKTWFHKVWKISWLPERLVVYQ